MTLTFAAVDTTLRVVESGFAHLANQPTVGLYYLRVQSCTDLDVLLHDETVVLAASCPDASTISIREECIKPCLFPLNPTTPQEHICSAAPTVVEDYRGTAALNRELEVIAPSATWIVVMLDSTATV